MTCGQAAQDVLDRAAAQDKDFHHYAGVIQLSFLTSDKSLSRSATKLSDQHMRVLLQNLASMKMTQVVIAVPSQHDNHIAYQIADTITQLQKTGRKSALQSAVFQNGYLYHDPAHPFYRQIQSGAQWASYFTVTVPTTAARKAILDMKPERSDIDKPTVLGHQGYMRKTVCCISRDPSLLKMTLAY